MSYAQLLKNLGFELDPFAQTNADEEDRLDKYFIPPPFFNAVYGDLSTPKSAVVFAPRGGGKTALKRKIEIASLRDPFLCITYNQFDTGSLRLKDVDTAYHLSAIVRLLVVAVITAVDENGIDRLSKDDRHILYLLAREHLSKIDQTTLKAAIAGVQNFSTKAKELWNKFTGPVGLVLNTLLTTIGLPSTDIDKFEQEGGSLGAFKDQLTVLKELAVKLDYKCVYILVDKVDETSLTGKASTSYQFIEPILSDLQLLELDGFGFKLFLWDALADSYRTVARPDRVKYYILEWRPNQLRHMLSERLKAFSNQKVESLAQITTKESEQGLSLDDVVSMFAQGSPRTMIRICKEILDQQSEIDAGASSISAEAVRSGFDQMAKNFSIEMYAEQLIKDLQRNRRCDFTIRHVYSNVFKFTQQAGLNKVRAWEDAGAIESLGTIQDTMGAKASNHYGLANLLLAKHVFSELSIHEFVHNKLVPCPQCAQLLLRDWDLRADHLCHGCQHEVQKDG